MTNNQLTLEQAIQHAKERAVALSGPCAAQHEQLATWLHELQERRKAAMDSEPEGEFYEDGPLNWYQISDGDRVPAHRRIPLYRHAQQPVVESEFIPKNLDKALGVVGVALPESKEEFNFQSERWIQRLIDRVIRYADEFKEQPAPVVPEEIEPDSNNTYDYVDGWNACRAAMLNGDSK